MCAGSRDQPVDPAQQKLDKSHAKTVQTSSGQAINVTLRTPDKKAQATEKKQKLINAFRGFAVPADFVSWVQSCVIESQLAQARLADVAVDASSIPRLVPPYLSAIRVGFSSLAPKIPSYLRKYAPQLVPLEAFLTKEVQNTIALMDALEVVTKDNFDLPDFCRVHNEHRKRSPCARDVFNQWASFLGRLAEWTSSPDPDSPPRVPDYGGTLSKWSQSSETVTYMREPPHMRKMRQKFEAANAKKSGGGTKKSKPNQPTPNSGARPRRKKGGQQKPRSGGGGGKKNKDRRGNRGQKSKGQGQSSD